MRLLPFHRTIHPRALPFGFVVRIAPIVRILVETTKFSGCTYKASQ
jgi:nitrate reductase gamma subunit